jgi:peroxiredoxin
MVRIVLAAAVTAVLFTGCSVQTSAAKGGSVHEENKRKKAPEFSLKDATGATVKLSDFRGKVVLLNFWATWCGPCKIEIPWFVDFQQTYKDRDLVVLGVSMDDDGWESVKPYVEKHKMNYRVVIGTEELSTLYGGIDALPSTFLIDRDGRIAASYVGLVSKDEYQNDLLKILDKSKTPSKVGSRGICSVPALLWTR